MTQANPYLQQASGVIDAIVAEFCAATSKLIASIQPSDASGVSFGASNMPKKVLNRQAVERYLASNGWRVASIDMCFMYLCKHGETDTIIGFTACPIEGVESRYFENFCNTLALADKQDKVSLMTQFLQ